MGDVSGVGGVSHGTRVRYVVGRCRCDECREANRLAAAEYERRKREGRSLFVPAGPVRSRVLLLMAKGLTEDEIARAAGLNDARLSDLTHGHWRTGRPLTRMKRENAEAIMAVRRRVPRPRTYVTAPDFRDMVLDLMALGYSAAWIIRSLGMSYQGRGPLLREHVTAATYAKMVRLHGATTEHAPESPEAARSRNFAEGMRRSDGVWRRSA